MRTAIPLLAAFGLALTGCYSHSNDPGTVTFYWRFQDASNAIAGDYSVRNTGCDLSTSASGSPVATVDSLDISIAGSVFTESCVQSNGSPGVVSPLLYPGTYPYTVDGFRNNERVFTTSGTVTVLENADVEQLLTLTAITPQSFVIGYPVTDTSGSTSTTCVFNGRVVGGITYWLEDARGQLVSTTQVALAGGAVGQQPLACDPSTLTFSVPGLSVGNYTLRYLQAIDTNGVAIVEDCNVPVFHGGFLADVPLSTAPSAACASL